MDGWKKGHDPVVPQHSLALPLLADECGCGLWCDGCDCGLCRLVCRRGFRPEPPGVTDAFWGLAPPGATRVPALGADTAVLNDHLAARLDASPGDVVVLRVRNPGSVPGDAPLSSDRAESVALRMTVEDVVGEDGFGRFSLRANQLPPDTVFVPRRQLQDAIGRPGRINLVLMGASGTHSEDGIREVVRRNWRLDDSELIVSYVESANQYALSSPRVFLDGPIERAALEACDEALARTARTVQTRRRIPWWRPCRRA